MCEYCDLKGFESTGYSQSTKKFDGDYEDAVVLKTNNDVDEDIYLKGYVEPNKYYLLVEGDGMGMTQINFCPVCGRKLIK